MELSQNNILICVNCLNPPSSTTPEERNATARQKWLEVDTQIRISTDIFNLKTMAIHEMKKAIDEDPSVPADQKYFELAKLLDSRYTKLIDVIFGARNEVIQAENEQRAIQVYYNELGKRLRTEEREKIRLKDANYKPLEVKPEKTPKAPKLKKPDVNEIRAACVKHGIPEAANVIALFCLTQNKTVEDAILSFKRAKSSVVK